MKYLLSILVATLCWVNLSAQQAQPVNPDPQRFVITKYEPSTSNNILYLDTSTGELKCIEWNPDSSKTQIFDFVGGPSINANDSYNGRFSLICCISGGWNTFMLIDHKYGNLWQLHKGISQHTLTQIITELQ